MTSRLSCLNMTIGTLRVKSSSIHSLDHVTHEPLGRKAILRIELPKRHATSLAGSRFAPLAYHPSPPLPSWAASSVRPAAWFSAKMRRFDVPFSSKLSLRLSCALLTNVKLPVQGTLFVFRTHICFESAAHAVSFSVPLTDVSAIEKTKGLFGTLPTRVQLVHGKKPTKHVVTFISLRHREKLFAAMFQAWESFRESSSHSCE